MAFKFGVIPPPAPPKRKANSHTVSEIMKLIRAKMSVAISKYLDNKKENKKENEYLTDHLLVEISKSISNFFDSSQPGDLYNHKVVNDTITITSYSNRKIHFKMADLFQQYTDKHIKLYAAYKNSMPTDSLNAFSCPRRILCQPETFNGYSSERFCDCAKLPIDEYGYRICDCEFADRTDRYVRVDATRIIFVKELNNYKHLGSWDRVVLFWDWDNLSVKQRVKLHRFFVKYSEFYKRICGEPYTTKVYKKVFAVPSCIQLTATESNLTKGSKTATRSKPKAKS